MKFALVVFVACCLLVVGTEAAMWRRRVVSAAMALGKRNEVDLVVDPNGPAPNRESVEKALKDAEAVMQEAIKKVEDPAASLAGDEVEIPVMDTDENETAKPKRRGLVRVTIGKK